MIIELRQYTLVPGRRDDLVTLFEREFVESQEALGMRIVGTFRDRRDPDRFVWLRAFADMPSRSAGLTGFYGGPVWAEHREAANATMVDSDDVLLLRPVHGELPHRDWPARVLVIVHLPEGDAEPDVAAGERCLGVSLVVLRTADEVNDFPALPVRPERAVVWWAVDAPADARDRLGSDPSWRVPGEVQLLELEPTTRSTAAGRRSPAGSA